MKTRKQILAEGYTIDDCCYPPFAYKGPRFKSTEGFEILTKLEEELIIAANVVLQARPGGKDDNSWVGMFAIQGNRLVELLGVVKQAERRSFKRFK